MLNVKKSWKNWQLLTEKGRHIWAFKSESKNMSQHLQHADNISNEEVSKIQRSVKSPLLSPYESLKEIFNQNVIYLYLIATIV